MRLKTAWKATGCFVLAGILSIPAFAAQAPQYGQPYGQTNMRAPAMPGTLNYVEGQAELAGQTLTQNSVGSQMQPGQTLTTQNGRAEIILTPGVTLRVDNNSAVMADSLELGAIHFTVQQGRAMVECDQLVKDDQIAIAADGANAHLIKKGLYEFNAANGQVRVWDGQAKVEMNGKEKTVVGGHQLAMNADNKIKIQGFDKKTNEDAFYRWSSLRASYLAEANVRTAGIYTDGGPGWYGPGWYWSPWFAAYTWIPGDGIFWDPFGWGFFAPGFVGYAPFYGYGFYGRPALFGHGYVAPALAHDAFAGREFHGAPAFRANGMARGGFAGGGFHGGAARGGGGRGR